MNTINTIYDYIDEIIFVMKGHYNMVILVGDRTEYL